MAFPYASYSGNDPLASIVISSIVLPPWLTTDFNAFEAKGVAISDPLAWNIVGYILEYPLRNCQL